MADEKKSNNKADEASNSSSPFGNFWSHPDPFVEIVWMILSFLVIVYVINAFLILLSNIIGLFLGSSQNLSPFLRNLFSYWKYFAWIISIVISAGIVYLYIKLRHLRKLETEALYIKTDQTKELENPAWQRVLDNLLGPGENDWKLAIMEADVMLGDLLNNMALPGESIGEKLKAVDGALFRTINNAWEAHKIRNEVAHRDSTFFLSQHEARRVVELYRTVFEEFKII